jgi:peroxiredoxin Q/BCP
VRVIGCSPDTVEAQAAFKQKNNLPFTLLADADRAIAEQFGVYALRTRPTGEQSWGVQRVTFIVEPDGTISRTVQQVDPTTHAKELLAQLL